MQPEIKSGLEFFRLGKVWKVGALRLALNKLELHGDDGDMTVIDPENLRAEFADGDSKLLVKSTDGTYVVPSSNWQEFQSDRAKVVWKIRIKILKFVDQERLDGKTTAEITESLKDYCKDIEGIKLPPCERTLRNWRARTRGHEVMLSPAWHRCGNRNQGPDDLLRKAIREVVDVAVFKSDLFTMTAAWKLIEARYDELWRQENGTDPVPAHSRKQLKTFLREIPWSELIKLRMDARTASALTRTAVHPHVADFFWDCVEMDATVLDILICDENGNEIGRPVLYVAIDVATGYVVGLYLTIQKPSAFAFVECLRFMYFPKPEGFDEQYGIKQRIEVFGLPVELKVDNGSEFIGTTATEVVVQLHGDSARCRPYRPQEKPHVERFNGTLKSRILTLRGATTSSVDGQWRLRRKGEKLMTIDELRGEIYRFTYDNYSLRMNEMRSLRGRKAVAPYDIWKEMAATMTQPIPVNRNEFESALFFKRESRVLSLDGISFEGWMYHSDELRSLYHRFGHGNCDFLYSDLDAMTIAVVPPNGGDSITAFVKGMDGVSVDRATASFLRKKILSDGKELNRRTFDEALSTLRAQQKIAKSSRSRAEQARIDDMLDKAEAAARKTRPHKSAQRPTDTPIKLAATNGGTTKPRARKFGEE